MTVQPTDPATSRQAWRLALRDELARGRAALRSGRVEAAAEATRRLPRWRPSRGQAVETPASPPPPAMPAPVIEPEPDSIYAGLLRDAGVVPMAELLACELPEAPAEPPADDPVPVEAVPLPEPAPLPVPEPTPEAVVAPAGLSDIAELGPGMRARLRLLGCVEIADLADAEPAALREALGEISRLLNVEAWIAEARRLAARPR